MSQLKLKKLDSRNIGYLGNWKFYVQIDVQQISKIRQWCWETWGPSKDMSEFDYNDDCANEHWCWFKQISKQHTLYLHRIYLKTEEAATLFTLRWL